MGDPTRQVLREAIDEPALVETEADFELDAEAGIEVGEGVTIGAGACS